MRGATGGWGRVCRGWVEGWGWRVGAELRAVSRFEAHKIVEGFVWRQLPHGERGNWGLEQSVQGLG